MSTADRTLERVVVSGQAARSAMPSNCINADKGVSWLADRLVSELATSGLDLKKILAMLGD